MSDSQPDCHWTNDRSVDFKNLIMIQTVATEGGEIKDSLHHKDMGIAHVNVHSIISTMDYTEVWAQQSDPDIFVFSETKLPNKDADICLDNYSVFRVFILN